MQLNCVIKLFYNSTRGINWYFFLIVLGFSINLYGQNNKACEEELLGKSFISDGQDHQVLVKNSKPARLNVVFYPQFKYRLVVCLDNKQLPVEFKLMDAKGKVHFTNANKGYIRTWDFQFASVMNAVIEFKLANTEIKEENIGILIGYQTLKTL